MARDPNERVGPGQFLEKPEQFKTLGIAIPQGFVVGTSTGQYYAHYNVHADGHTTVEWYKRGSGGGGENPDPVVMVTPGVAAADIKAEWDKEDAKAAATASQPISAPPTQANIVTQAPGGGLATTPNPNYVPPAGAAGDWHTEGRPDGQGGFDNTRPIMARTVNGVRETREPRGEELRDWNLAGQIQRNPGGKTDAEIAAEADKNRPGAPTLKPDGKGGTVAVQTMPDGTIKTTPLPGVPSDAAAAYTDIKQDPKTGAWTGLTKEGQWVPISGGPGLAPEKPTIRGQEGRPDIQYVPDPNNPGRVIAVPIQGTGTSTAGLPPGFARPQFSPMQVSSVLGQTQQKLDTWVSQATDENDRRARMQKATELMTEAHREATTYINEQQIGTTTARDVYGNQVQERGQTISRQNQLTSSGAGMANQAVGTMLPLLRYAQAGSGDPAKALQQLMGMMQGSVGAMGGLGAAPATIPIPGMVLPYMQGGSGAGAVAPAGVAPTGAPAAPGVAPVAPGVAPTAPAAALSPAAGAQRPWTDPETGPSVMGAAHGMEQGGMPPLAIMQALLDRVEPMMQADPNWGVNDLAEIQVGRSPWG